MNRIKIYNSTDAKFVNTPCVDMTAAKRKSGSGDFIKDKYGKDLFINTPMESHTTKTTTYYLVSDTESDSAPQWLTKQQMRLRYGAKSVARAMQAYTEEAQ
jgi:hypothetical protein